MLPDKHEFDPMHLAAKNGHVNVAEFFYEMLGKDMVLRKVSAVHRYFMWRLAR